jgi:undecaprenyl diphosphate synthase
MPTSVPEMTKPVPRHVAIIMDGNGRWASQRGLPRAAGHRRGVEAVRRAVRAAAELGIEYLPQEEVSFLLDLLRRFIRTDVADLHKAGIRITVIGDRTGLDDGLVKMIDEAEALTAGNSKLKLVVAFNYGSRQEITKVTRAIARKVAEGKIHPDDITPAVIANHLDTGGMPDPDLLIRTGGEQRLSNYLLWQCAYSEFVFLPEYWPDFDAGLLETAIAEFRGRDRRFGGLKVQSG